MPGQAPRYRHVYNSFEAFEKDLEQHQLGDKEYTNRVLDFTRAYLQFGPKFEFESVWSLLDVPKEIRDQLQMPKKGSPEYHLVAIGKDAKLTTIGVALDLEDERIPGKIRDLRKDSKAADRRMMISLGDRVPENVATTAKKVGVSLATRRNLAALPPEFFERWNAFAQGVEVEGLRDQRPEFEAAIENAVYAFESGYDRAQIIAPPTWGKAQAAREIAERTEARRVVVLGPTLHAVLNALQAWAGRDDVDVAHAYVGSDPSLHVSYGDRVKRCEFARDIRKFWEGTEQGARIKVLVGTYGKMDEIREGMSGLPEPDLLVLDDAHRLTGNRHKKSAEALSNKFFPASKRLLTAPAAKIKAESGAYSMDQVDSFGPVVHQETLDQSMGRGTLSDYRIEIVFANKEDVPEVLKEDMQENLDLLAKANALHKATEEGSIRHVIAYHATAGEKGAEEFKKQIGRVNRQNKVHIFADKVTGDMPVSERMSAVSEFENSAGGILSTARALTDGPSLPVADAVAFMDPSRVKTDIAKGAARTMAYDPESPSKEAVLIVPVVHDSNLPPQEAMAGRDWRAVRDVIEAMAAHDGRLAAQIHDLNTRKAKREKGDLLNGKIRLSGLEGKEHDAYRNAVVDFLSGIQVTPPAKLPILEKPKQKQVQVRKATPKKTTPTQ